MYLNLLYPVYSLIHLFPDNSTWHPVHPHRINHTLDPSTCFLDTLYFLFNSEIASVAETFLVKTFLTLWRHSASNGMLSILKLDSILLTLLSTVIHVSFPLSLSQKGICSSIVYHKTLHLYYKFPYYEKRTHNLLRCHCHSNLPPLHFRCLPLRLTIFLTTLYHCDTIFCDTLQGLQANH